MGWPVVFHGWGISCAQDGGRDGSPTVWSVFRNHVDIDFRTRTAAAWVYGSLVKPGRFHELSDVDVTLKSLPDGMTLEYLQSLLSADVGREVDVCLIDRTRLRPVIEGSGERWIA